MKIGMLRTASTTTLMAALVAVLTGCSSTGADASADAAGEDDFMAAMVAAAAPGEHHALLADMAGHWDVATQWWAAGDAEPVIGTARAQHTMAMGGRYLHMEFTGLDEEMPFEGFGILGFDNATRCYQNVWHDSSSTVIMFHQSDPDPSGRAIATRGTHVDALTGHTIDARIIWTVESDNRVMFEMYESHDGAPEYRSLKIIYTKN